MAQIDIYRDNFLRKKAELAKLQSDKATETKKAPIQTNKILSAKRAIQTTKSASIITSKLREIETAEKALADIEKKVADIDSKIAKKEKEIADEEKKFRQEEAREQKKRDDLEKKRLVEADKQFKQMQSTLSTHERIQVQMKRDIFNLQSIPKSITVLFMASNPTGTIPLRLDEEARSIYEMIRKSEHRDSVKFETRWAVRPLDVLQAINELNPSVVHFSGHGSETEEIVLQDTNGNSKLVTKEAIVQTMMTSSEQIRLVFFNTCFSHTQAKAVVKHVEAAIGMTISIGDDAAMIFAAQFYSAIGFGLSVKKSFEQAKAALMLEGIPEENTPELYVRDGLDPNDIIIVKP
ncbi:MAG: CHAT domain-containing protein [Treponema sp.]|jgi:hypothetical protein|nr:CHAT domain-containing protein [Treponema sp.]